MRPVSRRDRRRLGLRLRGDGLLRLAARRSTPTRSRSRTAGTAGRPSGVWFRMSGVGVRTAAMTKLMRMAYFRFFERNRGVTMPIIDSTVRTSGSSNTRPNASVNFRTKSTWFGHRDHGLDALLLAEAHEERDRERHHDEQREGGAGEEQERSDDHEGPGVAPLVLVQAGGHERPHLPEDDGHGEEQPAHHRELHARPEGLGGRRGRRASDPALVRGREMNLMMRSEKRKATRSPMSVGTRLQMMRVRSSPRCSRNDILPCSVSSSVSHRRSPSSPLRDEVPELAHAAPGLEALADGAGHVGLGLADGLGQRRARGRARPRWRRRRCSRCRGCSSSRCAAAENAVQRPSVPQHVHRVALEVPALDEHAAGGPMAWMRRAASSMSSRVATGMPVRASASGRFGVTTRARGRIRPIERVARVGLEQRVAGLGDHHGVDHQVLEPVRGERRRPPRR